MAARQMRRILTFLIIILWSAAVHAQNGQMAAMRGTVADSYNFWLYAPREYVYEHRRIPVIIFLHGASLCGNNM